MDRQLKKPGSALILLSFILIIGIAPLVWMFGASIWSPQGLTLQNYAASFQEVRTFKLLGNTIALGMMVVGGTLLLGVPLGFLSARTDRPFRNMLSTVLLIPLFLPPYILAVAWSCVLGKRGLLHKWFSLGEPASAFLHSLAGGATILTLAFLPIAILFIKTALAQVHVEIEEAARLEASRQQILRHITLPLIAPAMLSSGILIVIIAYLARFLILTERMFLATLKQIPPSCEEAAMIDGASTAQIWSRILLPLTAPTMAAAWILAFVFCFGDLGATLIVYPAGGATLPIRLYTIMANSPESVTAAMSVILVLPILLAVFLVAYLSKIFVYT